MPAAASTENGPRLAIRELRLLASELDSLVPFYLDTLGLELAERTDETVSFVAGATRLTYLRAPQGQQPYYHVAFNIPENKLPAAIEWSQSRFELIPRNGTHDPVVHFRNINAHSVYFFDPVGNLLEFIARHEMPNAAKGNFSAADVLNMSEIGIVVDDVQGFVGKVQTRFGLDVYPTSRQPSDQFSAVGSGDGTFIVVRRRRIWLMTEDLEGAVFPTEVIIQAPRPGELDLAAYPYQVRAI